MTGDRLDRCQNCGFSKRHSRQKPNEKLQYVACCSAWMCAACRKLRGCADPSKPPTAEMLSIHTIASRVPVNDGLYAHIPDTVYHGDPHSLSSSGARTLTNKTPAEFLEERNTPPNPKPQYDFGHAAHLMVLGAGSKLVRVDAEDWRTKDARMRREKAWAQDKVPLLKRDIDVAQRMAGKVFTHPVAARLLAAGTPEVSAYWHDDDTGVRLRARFDFVPERKGRMILVDYKTSADASPAGFTKSVEKFGYDQQAAWYIDAAREVGISDDPAFLFIVQQKTSPFLVSLNQIEPEWIEHGRAKNRQAINLYSDCVATDTWPGHGDDIHTAVMPVWLRRHLEAATDAA